MSPKTLQKQTAKAGETAKTDLWDAIKTVVSLQNQAPPLVPISRDGIIPLSYPQERLWFRQQLQPDRAIAYNIPLGFRIWGELNRTALQRSLDEILRRHEALRTTYAVTEGKSSQIIHSPAPFDLPTVDLRTFDPEYRETRLADLMRIEIRRPFDLGEDPPIRGILFRLDERDYLLLFTVHHIAVDAWSKGIFYQELAALYEAFGDGKPSPLAELPVQYADFSGWQRRTLQGELRDLLLNYWRRQLDGLQPLQLPRDRRPEMPTHRGGSHKLRLSPELTKAIKTFSRREGVTPFVTLLTAFKILLNRYGEQDDIFVCSPIANRNRKEIKGAIGYFVNLLILRTKLDGRLSFHKLLDRVRQTASGGYAHQDLPVQDVVEALNLASVPLSRAMFALQNTAVHQLQLPGLQVETLDLDTETADFDLYLYLIADGDGLAAVFKYDADLFDAATIAEMGERYRTILERAIADPERTPESLLPLTASEVERFRNNRENPVAAGTPAYVAPRNEVERQLAELWAGVLGIDRVGVGDNFFHIGGQSLLAMSLVAQIEAHFGRTLPLATLLQAPTVEGMAKLLAEDRPAASSLVRLKSGGDQPPFFCIHGQHGNVLNFRELANLLDCDRPVYALQARGLDGREAPECRIEAIAAHYIAEIRTVRPRGPYFLGGNSMGGTVAFEMAQQLRRDGEEVALLAMFDSFHKTAFPRLAFRGQHFARYLLQLGPSKALAEEVSDGLRRKFRSAIGHISLRLGRTVSHRLCREWVRAANMAAKWAYEPRVYPGRIVLFRAQNPARFDKPYFPTIADWGDRDRQHGWGELAGGGLEIYDVPGDHFSIFEPPHVKVLADHLNSLFKSSTI